MGPFMLGMETNLSYLPPDRKLIVFWRKVRVAMKDLKKRKAELSNSGEEHREESAAETSRKTECLMGLKRPR